MGDELRERIIAENIQVHEQEAPVYDKCHSEVFNAYEQRRIRRDLDRVCSLCTSSGRAVLDIGCGTGNLALKLHEREYRVTGVDLSGEMLEILRRKNPDLELVESDVDSYLDRVGSEASFDIICFSAILHHLPDYLETLTKASRLLRAGGVLYIIHEPAARPDEPVGILGRIVHKLDWKYYVLTMKLHGIARPKLDYSFSDYHVFHGGVNADAICAALRELGLVIETNDRYWARKSPVLAFLDDRLLKTPSESYLRIIARK